MQEHLAAFTAAGRTEGVLFVGRTQEKTGLFRTEKRRTPEGRPYPWIVKATGMVNREVPGRLHEGAGVGAGSPRPHVAHPESLREEKGLRSHPYTLPDAEVVRGWGGTIGSIGQVPMTSCRWSPTGTIHRCRWGRCCFSMSGRGSTQRG